MTGDASGFNQNPIGFDQDYCKALSFKVCITTVS